MLHFEVFVNYIQHTQVNWFVNDYGFYGWNISLVRRWDVISKGFLRWCTAFESIRFLDSVHGPVFSQKHDVLGIGSVTVFW
jgi:hypothetical protein